MERRTRVETGSPPIAAYREFAPCAALEPYVYAFFSFAPAATAAARRPLLRETVFGVGDSFSSPLFADGNVSLGLRLGRVCDALGRWHVDPIGPTGEVIGPMTVVGTRTTQERPEMVGVYFRPAQASPFVHMPISELTDRIVGVDDVWRGEDAALPARLCELDETARIDRLEARLVERLAEHRRRAVALDMASLTDSVLRRGGAVTVAQLARAAGVSRQHLARVFHERVGVSPKTYCNLARFHSGLVYAGCGDRVDWAHAAAGLGYSDQSHMIAEFRRFSSLTPSSLSAQRWFHPFIARARARVPRA